MNRTRKFELTTGGHLAQTGLAIPEPV